MKFTVGPIPEDAHFQPDGDVWTIVREPSLEKIMLLSAPLVVLLGLGTAFLWVLLTPVKLDDVQMLWSFAAFPVCIPLHEFAHACGFPTRGWIAKTCFGVWKKHDCGPLPTHNQL